MDTENRIVSGCWNTYRKMKLVQDVGMGIGNIGLQDVGIGTGKWQRYRKLA